MRHLFPHVGEKRIQAPTDADRDALERKRQEVMATWPMRSLIDPVARARLTRVKEPT